MTGQRYARILAVAGTLTFLVACSGTDRLGPAGPQAAAPLAGDFFRTRLPVLAAPAHRGPPCPLNPVPTVWISQYDAVYGYLGTNVGVGPCVTLTSGGSAQFSGVNGLASDHFHRLYVVDGQ